MASTPAGVPVTLSTSATSAGAATAMEPATIPEATARIAIRILIACIRSCWERLVARLYLLWRPGLNVILAKASGPVLCHPSKVVALGSGIRIEDGDARMCDGHHIKSLSIILP